MPRDSGDGKPPNAPNLVEAAPDMFAAIHWFMLRLRDSENVAYYCGLGTETFERMCRAYAKALGKTEELKGHLYGALNLGIEREELIEVLMQTACYAGVPTAVAALTAAAEVLNPPAK